MPDDDNHTYYMPGVTDNIGFLISDVSRLMRRRFDDRARQIGITRAVAHADNGQPQRRH